MQVSGDRRGQNPFAELAVNGSAYDKDGQTNKKCCHMLSPFSCPGFMDAEHKCHVFIIALRIVEYCKEERAARKAAAKKSLAGIKNVLCKCTEQ